MSSEPVEVRREAVRGLVLTPAGRVLLLHVREPARGLRLWLTPGGGLDDGEDPRACLRRELHEETGLDPDHAPGPVVWTRCHRFTWNRRRVEQRETFYLVSTETFEPTAAGNPEPSELDTFLAFRWWSVEEIERSEERFVPRRLGAHLRALLEEGPPAVPIDVGP